MDEFYFDSAEDYIIDDEAEAIENAMDDLIEYDYSDIDNIADIDDEDDEDDDDEYLDEDDFEDDSEYIDYEIPDDFPY